jgi:hypothetical protein
MRFEREIEDFFVVAQCKEDLAIQASALLSKLEQLHRQGPALHPGTVVQFGWSRLVLEAEDKNLVVCEPDFDGDPFHHTVPEVDRTLRVVSEQAGICRLVQAVGPDVSFDQTMIVAKGHVATPRIYLDRRASELKEFSGWYLGPFDEGEPIQNEDQLEPRYLYQLLELRPAVLSVLNLPINYIVVFGGDKIETIFDSAGTVAWAKSN